MVADQEDRHSEESEVKLVFGRLQGVKSLLVEFIVPVICDTRGFQASRSLPSLLSELEMITIKLSLPCVSPGEDACYLVSRFSNYDKCFDV